MQAWPKDRARFHLTVAIVLGGAIMALAAAAGPWWATVLGPVVGSAYFHLSMRRFLWRRQLVRRPFPEAWRDTLSEKVPFYRNLDEEGRRRFETDVQIFLDEQEIYGIRGARVAEEVRLLVAASAATLGHGLPDWEWPRMRDIVVYPTSFDEEYRVADGRNIAGMVHRQGPILFSEKDLRLGFLHSGDGHNVGLHEMAHVLDMAAGAADGIPAGLPWVATAPWVKVMADRLRTLREGDCGKVLRCYAGANEAELFAVAVEAFFERPGELRDRDGALYDLLKDYFGQDPAAQPTDPAG